MKHKTFNIEGILSSDSVAHFTLCLHRRGSIKILSVTFKNQREWEDLKKKNLPEIPILWSHS